MEGGDVEGRWVVDATPTYLYVVDKVEHPARRGSVYCSICNQMLSFLVWRAFCSFSSFFFLSTTASLRQLNTAAY